MPPLDELAVDVASPAKPIAAKNGLSASGSFLSVVVAAAADEDDADDDETVEDFFGSLADDFFSLSAVLDEPLLLVVVVAVAVLVAVVGDDSPAIPFIPNEFGSIPGKAKAPGKVPRPIPSSEGLANGFCIIIICICS